MHNFKISLLYGRVQNKGVRLNEPTTATEYFFKMKLNTYTLNIKNILPHCTIGVKINLKQKKFV